MAAAAQPEVAAANSLRPAAPVAVVAAVGCSVLGFAAAVAAAVVADVVVSW